MEQNAAFPQRLQTLREKQRLSRRTLAELCGLSKNMISLYERGEKAPSVDALIKLADYFGVSIDFLLGKRFVKGVFSKQSHSSPWKQHITGFPRGIFRKFHNLYLSANPSIYGYVISLPFIFAYSAKLLRAFAKPTISDSFNVQITDSHSLIHFFVCFICSSEI